MYVETLVGAHYKKILIAYLFWHFMYIYLCIIASFTFICVVAYCLQTVQTTINMFVPYLHLNSARQI